MCAWLCEQELCWSAGKWHGKTRWHELRWVATRMANRQWCSAKQASVAWWRAGLPVCCLLLVLRVSPRWCRGVAEWPVERVVGAVVPVCPTE
jgi:hypothetical protein